MATNLDEKLIEDSVFTDPITGTAVISSTSIAARLGRSHKTILTKIEMAQKCCGAAFFQKHFICQGDVYWLTKDGLILTASCISGGAYVQKCLALLLHTFAELEQQKRKTNELTNDSVIYWQRVLADTLEEKNLVTRQRDYYRAVLPDREYGHIAYVSI